MDQYFISPVRNALLISACIAYCDRVDNTTLYIVVEDMVATFKTIADEANAPLTKVITISAFELMNLHSTGNK